MRQVLAVKVNQDLALSADVAGSYAIENPQSVACARTDKGVDAIERAVDGAVQQQAGRGVLCGLSPVCCAYCGH